MRPFKEAVEVTRLVGMLTNTGPRWHSPDTAYPPCGAEVFEWGEEMAALAGGWRQRRQAVFPQHDGLH
jgi:hypothetical protein